MNMSRYTSEQIKAIKDASDAITGAIRGLVQAGEGNTKILCSVAGGVQPPGPSKPPKPVPPPPPPPSLRAMKKLAADLLKAAARLESAFSKGKS